MIENPSHDAACKSFERVTLLSQSQDCAPMMTIFCSVEDCPNPADAARGWCWKHYYRWRRYGDPLQRDMRRRGTSEPKPEVLLANYRGRFRCATESCSHWASRKIKSQGEHIRFLCQCCDYPTEQCFGEPSTAPPLLPLWWLYEQRPRTPSS